MCLEEKGIDVATWALSLEWWGTETVETDHLKKTGSLLSEKYSGCPQFGIIHSFGNCLLSTYYLPGTLLGIKDSRVNKINSRPHEAVFH